MSGIFCFRPFGRPLGSHPGSWWNKFGPDMTSENSIKSRYAFCTCQALYLFFPLVAPWRPILDPCGKSEVLTGTHKIQ